MVTAFVTGECIFKKNGTGRTDDTRHALDRARKAGGYQDHKEPGVRGCAENPGI